MADAYAVNTAKAQRGHTRAKPPITPLDMPARYSTGNVLAVSGWSHSTLYQRITQGKFPKPLKDGSRNYWTTAVVRTALGL